MRTIKLSYGGKLYVGTMEICKPRRPIPRKHRYPMCRFCANTSRKKTKYDTCVDKRACKRTIIKRIDACPTR
jgi:hypothetical protein